MSTGDRPEFSNTALKSSPTYYSSATDSISKKKKKRKIPSHLRRLLLILIGFVHCAFASGVVFGWAPLELILKMEGVYASKCKPDEQRPCPEQLYMFGMIFTFGTVAVNSSQLLSGYVLDTFGPKLNCMFFSLVLGIGFVLFGFSNDTTFPAFIPAYILMGIGGPPILNSSLHLSNLYPTWMSTIKSLFSGLFGASALVFFGFEYIFEKYHISRKTLFVGYLPVIIFVGASASVFWPSKPYLMEQVSEHDKIIQPAKANLDNNNPLKQKGFFGQVFSIEFLGMVLFMSLGVVRLNFFAQTMDGQLARRGDASHHYLYSKAFAVIAPLGFLGTPIIGILLDKAGLVTAFIFVNTCQLLFNGMFMIPILPLQIATFIVYAVCRSYLYSSKFALIANRMGFKNFGKLAGTCNCLIGILQTTQFGLSKLLKDVFKQNAIWIHFGFVILGVLAYLYPLYLWISNRRIKRDLENKSLLSNSATINYGLSD